MKAKKVLGLTLSAALAVSAAAPWTGVTAFAADENTDVAAATQSNDCVVKLLFICDGEFVAGGDYPLENRWYDMSELAEYCPDGYEMISPVSGFMPANTPEIKILVKKIENPAESVRIVVKYRYEGKDLLAVDREITEGVHNYSELAEDVPAGYTMATSGDFYAEQGAEIVVDLEKEVAEDVIMNIRFMDGDTFVAGGDYFLPAGVQNYTILDQYVPDGYKITEVGEFFVKDGGKLDVPVEKIDNLVRIVVKYRYDGKDLLAVDRAITEGVHNYSELAEDVPAGYKMAVAGDFYAKQGAEIVVDLEKEVAEDVIMNIRFMDGDTFVAGGDYFLPAGVQNYTILNQYVPTGYRITEVGDFFVKDGGKLDVPVEKIENVVRIVVKYRYDGKDIVAVDRAITEGVHNYSELAEDVPAGYKMAVAGDFYAKQGAEIVVDLEKEAVEEIIMNIRFMDGDTFVAGGDYFVPAGVQNYNVLKKYVPEGYQMCVSGDFMAANGAKLEVPIEKIKADEIIMNIRFMDGDTFVAGGDYFVPAGVQNYSILEKYVPEGYKMSVSGDFMAVEGGKLVVPIEKDEKPVDPDDGDDDETFIPDRRPDTGDTDTGDKDDGDGEEITDPETPLVDPSTPDTPDAVPGDPSKGDPSTGDAEAIDDEDVAKTDAPPQTGRKVAGSLALLAGAAAVAAVTLKKRED